MKNVFALLVLLVLLAGCSAGAAPVMYIQPAELNEEEEAVAKLLGADTDQHLFDVVLDGTAKTVGARHRRRGHDPERGREERPHGLRL